MTAKQQVFIIPDQPVEYCHHRCFKFRSHQRTHWPWKLVAWTANGSCYWQL